MNKKILIPLTIIFLAAIGFFVFTQTKTTQSTNSSTVTDSESTETSSNSITPASSDAVAELRAGGSSYIDPKGVFSFIYPNDYQLDTQDKQHIRIFKQGATQRGQTEMYDGVLIVFESIDLGEKTLSEHLDKVIEDATSNGMSQIVKEKTQTTLNSYPGYVYSLQGLGTSEYIVIQKDASSKSAVSISMSIQDPENVGFQEEVNATISTLQLLK